MSHFLIIENTLGDYLNKRKNDLIYSWGTMYLTINFINSHDIDLYEKLIAIFELLKETNNIKIIINNDKMFVREKGEPKEQFIASINNIIQQNHKIKVEHELTINKLISLGCNINNISIPYKLIPDEWYNWNTYYDTRRGSITIIFFDEDNLYTYIKTKYLL